MFKTCTKCRQPKPVDCFSPSKKTADRRSADCRQCRSAAQIARYHADIEAGRARVRASTARRREKKRIEDHEYYAAHKQEKATYDRAYRQANLQKITNRVRTWKSNNRAHVNSQTNKSRQDPAVRLAHNISVQMRNVLRGRKDRSWQELVGYSAADLVAHLESLFTPGINWSNYGKHWHVEHRRPISSFNLPAETRECWALSNLCPLEAIENIRKGGRWNGFDPRTKPRTRRDAQPISAGG